VKSNFLHEQSLPTSFFSKTSKHLQKLNCNLLGIETSCDESSIAIVRNGVEPIAEATASQIKLMAPYGGVVPELSARKHLEALPILFEECRKQAGDIFKDLDAVAVTVDPGLPPALATGRAFAEGVALGLGLPLIEVNHLDAHLCSVLLEDKTPENAPNNYQAKVTFPHVALLVSGGHTNLFLVKSPIEHEPLGKTRDDAAGEAFDKVARILGLPYPGGPEISKYAEKSLKTPQKTWKVKEKPFTLPLPDEPFDFSFSGIKTAVRKLIVELTESIKHEQSLEKSKKGGTKVPKDIDVEKLGRTLPTSLRGEIAYYFQETVTDSLVTKALNAEKHYQTGLITLTGGVAANRRLREKLSSACASAGIKIKYPGFNRCTDNATMVASAGYYIYTHSLD